MQTKQPVFSINNVIKNYRLDPLKVSAIMFPENKGADLALRRVLRGEGRVFVEQLEALASSIGVSVATLYEVGCNTWRDARDGSESFRVKLGVYIAAYVYATHELTITVEDDVLFQEVLADKLLVEELMDIINSIIDGTYSN